MYLQKQDFVRAERALAQASTLAHGLTAEIRPPIAATYQAYARDGLKTPTGWRA